MRYIRYLVLIAIAIVLITVALANRAPLTVHLLPDELEALLGVSWDVTLPAFLILLAAVLVGVFLGFVWEWLREHRFRAEAVTERRERERLEAEVKKTAPPANDNGDDIRALVEAG